MYVLGLCEGHGASAALLKDGEIIGAVNEERLNRVKSFSGFPGRSIEYLLAQAGIPSSEIDRVILPSLHPFSFILDERNSQGRKTVASALFSSLLSERVYWTTARIGYRIPLLESLFLSLRNQINDRLVQKKLFKRRCESLSRHLEIDEARITACSHQLSHALAGLYTYPGLEAKELLVLTSDGMGNTNCGAVYIYRDGVLELISSTPNFHSLAFIYGMVTKYLGMKFMEHEYKLMGLAPYADEVGVAKVYEVLKGLMRVDENLRFVAANSTRVVYPFLEDKLKEMRFDWIAGAVQQLVEELVIDWVGRAVDKTGISRVVLGGGLFMNVKANMVIAQMEEVEMVYACPAASDESCALGAALYGWLYNGEDVGVRKTQAIPLHNLYQGPEYSSKEIEAVLNEQRAQITYERCENIEREVAQLLAHQKVVARFNGRMEYGPRALGNRSILADPSWEHTVQVINRLIKNRDFWMPFAASLLKERLHDYLVNPKDIPAPFMSIAFDTKERAWSEFRAGIHPYDRTMRPQVVEEGDNRSYYTILKEFEAQTGIGGVLNTSFNLHGSPIVCTPADAMETFFNSGLEYLAIGDYLVRKK